MRDPGYVKIFLSTVRQGLEGERDALPGRIGAIGHEPVADDQSLGSDRPGTLRV